MVIEQERGMIRVLLDANILFTYLTKREDPYLHECEDIIRLCAEGKIEGFIALHSLSIVWYLMRKYPEMDRMNCLSELCQILEMATPDMEMIRDGLQKGLFTDFEDLLQDCCAQAVQADYLVTANMKDFKNGVIPAVTPVQLLQIGKSIASIDCGSSLINVEISNYHRSRREIYIGKRHRHGLLKCFPSGQFHACLILERSGQ